MRKTSGLAVAVLLVVASGCYGLRVTVEPAPRTPYRVTSKLDIIGDDLDVEGLVKAARASLDYYAGAESGRRRFSLGYDTYKFPQLKRSVEHFLTILHETPRARLHQRIAEECRAYVPRKVSRFTAYYEPVLRGSKTPDERYRYPVYYKPDELTLVQLSRFFPEDERKFHGKVKGGELVPYLSREEIDGSGLLREKGLELAWVDDPVDLYFLHIQGSGRLKLESGEILRVNFAASNGMSYVSVGRYMLDNHILGPSQGSSSAIKAYLSANPSSRNAILFKNPRYIFFREVQLDPSQGPLGALGVPLVSGRSIATDQRYVPPGVLTYIMSDKPLLNEQGYVDGWQHFARFAFNHDAGAAIKGPSRADIYWGEGHEAGMAAGYMNRPGRMVVLMCGVRPDSLRALRQASVNAFTQVSWPYFSAPDAGALASSS
ncbi:MAG: murein transglycosylase A [Candidatus Binatia bacterium]